MKSLLTIAFTLFAANSIAGTAMKMEGSCNGTLANNTAVSFTYYSNFDGCKEKSAAAVSFSSGNGMGLYTGKRSFIGNKDVYSFQVKQGSKTREVVRLTFADSTGNTSGSLRYVDEAGAKKTVEVQCEIRDYEYAECEG